MKRSFLFLLFIIYLVVTGFHLSEDSDDQTSYGTAVKDCSDTDDDSIYVPGRITISYSNEVEEHASDFCNDKTLFEYSCFENKPRVPKKIECKAACRNGRCFDVYDTKFETKYNFSVSRKQARTSYYSRKEAEEQRMLRLKYFTDLSGNVIRVKTERSTSVIECTETDDGIDRYGPGEVSITYANDDTERFYDTCRNKELFEYTCDTESPRRPEIIRCKLSCSKGKCVDEFEEPISFHEQQKGFLPKHLRTKKIANELPQFLKELYDVENLNLTTMRERNAVVSANLRRDFITGCNETDNGEDIYRAGIITLSYNEGRERFFEKCLDRYNIIEYSCNNQYPRSPTGIRCPFGCELGACVKRTN